MEYKRSMASMTSDQSGKVGVGMMANPMPFYTPRSEWRRPDSRSIDWNSSGVERDRGEINIQVLLRCRTMIMAKDAIAVMDHLGWKKAHVFGHSMGGMIASKLSALFPDRVLSLALLNVTGGGYDCLPKEGDSGHEPAHAGFVGDGMLTAATVGMFLPRHLLLQFLLYLPPDELESYSSDFVSFLSFDTAYEL